MWTDEPGRTGEEARSSGWEEFRDARQRFLDRLARQTELLRLERIWDLPAATMGDRPGAGREG